MHKLPAACGSSAVSARRGPVWRRWRMAPVAIAEDGMGTALAEQENVIHMQ
jgi:hypothetical protein